MENNIFHMVGGEVKFKKQLKKLNLPNLRYFNFAKSKWEDFLPYKIWYLIALNLFLATNF